MTLAEFKRRMTLGKEFVCIENTLIPKYNGQRRIIVKAGASYVRWDAVDGSVQNAWTYFPKARDVVRSEDDTITFRVWPGDDSRLLTLHVLA